MGEGVGAGGQVGRVLDGRYRIVSELGSGGVGVVYRAEHLQLGRPVAVKLLHSEFGGSQNQMLRFEREARTLAALSHPHIVTVTDYGACDGVPYLVMELLEGRTLQELLRTEGALLPERALNILRQTLRALAFAHGQGLVHRDLKPGNIFLQALPDAPDHVRILDFGLAKFVAGDSAQQGPVLTRTGAVFGTPAYMAPEQASGDAVEASTDVYAAGVVLFEMLAGKRPFAGNMGELLKHHLLTPVPALHEARPDRAACAELEALLQTAMAKQRGDRYPDAAAMLTALEALPGPAVIQGGAATAPSPASAPSPEAATVAASPGPAGHEAGEPSRDSRPAPTPPTFPPPRERSSRTASLLGMGVVLLLSAGIGAAVWGWARTGNPSEAFKSAPNVPSMDELVAKVNDTPSEGRWARTEGPGDEAARPQNPSPPPASDLEDPWAEPIPSALAPVHRALQAGRIPPRSADDRLRRYARRHPEDPRPYLLLARTYAARGWRSDAIDRYERAFRVDPAAKGDPQMLTDLLTMVKHRAVSTKAARAIRSIFGKDALDAIDAKLATPGLGEDETDRLQRLKASIR